jgi:hypothetical protein
MICLLSAGVIVAALETDAVTLSWRHSVEKIPWEEDWRVENDRLVAVAARVQGSGAGMEPGPDARRDGPWWVWRPALPPQERLVLTRSQATTDYTLCWRSQCQSLGNIIPIGRETSATIIEPCLYPAQSYPRYPHPVISNSQHPPMPSDAKSFDTKARQ